VQDIVLFKAEIKRVFGLDTLLFRSDDWVQDTTMDLIMCSKSDFFISTYPGSFFSRFIEQERDLRQKNANTAISTAADVFKKRAAEMTNDTGWAGGGRHGGPEL
jgi:hypothetical protein